jgi:hypothetical protein
MYAALIQQIYTSNPWLSDPKAHILSLDSYIQRLQTQKLLLPDWDNLWLILTGPRRAGKTTLGKYLCQHLINEKKFSNLLYLNCDYLEIRRWLENPNFIHQALQQFKIQKPILFIDEAQRLENPGLLLKIIADLQLNIKMIASGSSQLEIKSKIQEHLTGRQIESLVLPLSYLELKNNSNINMYDLLTYGCYPQIVQQTNKSILLQQLYQDYVNKDLIEILKIGKPDIMQKLITLVAHSSGQLVNYSKLSSDCQVSTSTIYNYLDKLEKTYILYSIKPFVGNKRAEITSNPIYFFIDNGFRNQALNNFNSLEMRTDLGLLVESAVFQELYKFKTQNFLNFNINFWRTTAGAEVDFVITNSNNIIPIEVKYSNFKHATITRSFRSFLQAYQPKHGVVITKNYIDEKVFENTSVHFIPMENLTTLLLLLSELLKGTN